MDIARQPNGLKSFALAYSGGLGVQLIFFFALLVPFLRTLPWLFVSFFVAAFAFLSLASGFAGVVAGSWNTFFKVLLGGAVGLAACVVAVVGLLFWPMWVTPIAKLWYQPGFDDAVARALMEIPGHETACIYDDSQDMFVTSMAQLDVEQIIERAVSDKGPSLSLNIQTRDPHFRVYSGETTYYWSFKDERFYEFDWNRHLWTLADISRRFCSVNNRDNQQVMLVEPLVEKWKAGR